MKNIFWKAIVHNFFLELHAGVKKGNVRTFQDT